MAMRRAIRKSVFAAVTASTKTSPSRIIIDGVSKTLNTGNPVFNNVLSSKLLSSSFQNRFLSSASSHHSEGDSQIHKYGKDLTELARLSNVDDIIVQDDKIDRCIEILSRETKNKPVIIGESSLGRSAVTEGLAQRIVCGDVPETLMNRKLISLDMGSMLAGANFIEGFNERLKSFMKEVASSNGQIVLFIDEIHTVVGGVGGDLLAPMFEKDELRCIGATSLNGYRKYIEKNPVLECSFQQVFCHPPSVEALALGGCNNASSSQQKRRKEFYEALKIVHMGCQVLECNREDKNGICSIFLMGVSHEDEVSRIQVERLIEQLRPSNLFLELDDYRYEVVEMFSVVRM